MASVVVNDEYLSDIADAIRAKKGTQDTYKPSQMADAISSISGGITPTGTIQITQNGTVDVSQYASANVNVPTEASDWLDITPDWSNMIADNKTAYSYDASTDELRVYSTSNGTYLSARLPFVPESGVKYRLEWTATKNGSANSSVGFRNTSNWQWVASYSISQSGYYAFSTLPSERTAFDASNMALSFMVTQSSSTSGDTTWKNLRLYKYVGE